MPRRDDQYDLRHSEYREVRHESLAGGLNDNVAETRLKPDQTPHCENVDFDRGSVQSTGGAIKFGNQTAPGSAIRTRVDPGLSPLAVMGTALVGPAGVVEVPLRGWAYFPYSTRTDIGGRFDSEGDFMGGSETFHNRRGTSFEINATFRIPPEEKLYETPTLGSGAPATAPAGFNVPHGFDEALDECFCILQKGGDRTAPMSWALAVVNVGAGVDFSAMPARKPSTWALCFIWYDAPQMGESDVVSMKYNLTTAQSPIGGAAATYCTQALRAVVIHHYVQPGVRYNAALSLKLDTGSPGGVATNTAWQADGALRVRVVENGVRSKLDGTDASYSYVDSGAGTASGIEVYKGPSDSLRYLCRYGIRYAGRDAGFGGLGMRMTPWQRHGFIPFGSDGAALRAGGFQMVDRSAITADNLYGAANYTLTCAHTGTNAYVVVNHSRLTTGNTNGYADPKARLTGTATYKVWDGFGGDVLSAAFNGEALRNYRLVTLNDGVNGIATARGGILNILSCDTANPDRITVSSGASLGAWTTVGSYVVIQAFRWHQREIELSTFRIWSQPLDYADTDAILATRRKVGLRMGIDLRDNSHPDLAYLLAEWKCDDAEGGTLRESVVGGLLNGWIGPFANGSDDGRVFLSGEGEAIYRDLSQSPVFERELGHMLESSAQGFGFEITIVPTEAFYFIEQEEALPDQTVALVGKRPRLVPDLVVWDVRDATEVGTRSVPRPLLELSHRALLTYTDSKPATRPAMFGVTVGHKSDQENVDGVVPTALLPWYIDSGGSSSHFRYDPTAPWVGRAITIQVGVQSTGVADQYDVYISMSPKDAFLPAAGDPADAEFAYWTDTAAHSSADGIGYPSGDYTNYFTAAHLTVSRKDLARSVLCIGGRWNPRGKPGDTEGLGVHELNARMLVSQVRWFATAPSGALPITTGAIAASRNGKLEGSNALPQRTLTDAEIKTAIGEGVRSANLTNGSTTVSLPSQTSAYTAEPAASLRALKSLYFQVAGDEAHSSLAESLTETKPEFYRVASVTSGGASFALSTPYGGTTRDGAVCFAFRLCGYTTFDDDIRDRPLLLGRGSAYSPATTTIADVILTDTLWKDLSPVGGGWGLRIYSPLGRSSSVDILPRWTRGLIPERRFADDGVLGIHGFNERVYCGVRGALYEADDRWVDDGPSASVARSIRFRSEPLPGGTSAGLHDDRIEFTDGSLLTRVSISTLDEVARTFDAWVKLDGVGEFQTILWHGVTDSNPMLNVGSTAHLVNMIVRLNRGRPELVVGSTATYSGGSTVPEKGLYVATADITLPVDRWTHVRFILPTRLSGTVYRLPRCKVMGKTVTVRVNAVDGAVVGSDDWLVIATTLANNALQYAHTLVGIARDSYKAPSPSLTFNSTSVQGDIVKPARLHGYLHSFNGSLASLVVADLPWDGTEPDDFDPYTVSYQGAGTLLRFQILGETAEGVGHRVYDFAKPQNGIVWSHPFVSVYHELGRSSLPITWAEFGDQLYATNGGKPVVILPSGKALAAGVPTPLAAPTFTTERLTLWKANARSTGTDPGNDPVANSAAGSTAQVYHYNTNGNTFIQQTLSGADLTAMSWDKADYFALKLFWRPHSTEGRTQVWRKGTSQKEGGPFLDCVDGKARVGWWDVSLKQEVYVETSERVFWPGRVHYIYLRKLWPDSSLFGSNWHDSYYTNGTIRRGVATAAFTAAVGDRISVDAAGTLGSTSAKRGWITRVSGVNFEYVRVAGAFASGDSIFVNGVDSTKDFAADAIRPMGDMLVVERLRSASGDLLNAQDETVSTTTNKNERVFESFTTADLTWPTAPGATGLVSPPGYKYNGAASGVVNDAATGYALSVFTPDMVGMYWVWGTDAGTTLGGKKYRITTWGSATQITVIDEELGTNPDFSTLTAKTGGVFYGVVLTKSDSFDASRTPDTAPNVIEFMGARTQSDVDGVYVPHDGETWCPGWVMAAGASSAYTNAQVFETLDTSVGAAAGNDPMETGADWIYQVLYTGAVGPEPLRFDTSRAFYALDGQVYPGGAAPTLASTQPAQADVQLGLPGPTITKNSSSPAVVATAATVTSWAYIQTPVVWQSRRYVSIAFYDRAQAIVGNPSPAALIAPAIEDTVNPSGIVRTTISSLPVGRGDLELWVFCSLADGDKVTQFRVARVENGTASVQIEVPETLVLQGPALEFTNDEPPRCAIVGATAQRVLYGALEQQANAIVPSRVGFGGQADFSKLFQLQGGHGSAVTAMALLDGLLVAFKRRSIYSVAFNQDGNAIPDEVSGGDGAVSQASVQSKDSLLFFLSDRGVCVTSRAGVTNLNKPAYIGDPVKSFYLDEVDGRFLSRSFAAVNRRRNQYVLGLRATGDGARARVRVSIQTADEGLAFSRYSEPALVAMATVQSRAGGIERMVGGTEEGFMVWLDRPDTPLAMLGPAPGAWGFSTLVVTSTSTVYGFQSGESARLDLTLEGARGAVVRFTDAGGAEMALPVIATDGGYVLFAEQALSAAVADQTATIGVSKLSWETGWLDLGNPQTRKTLYDLDLIMRRESGGSLLVEVFADFDSDNAVASGTLDLTQPVKRLSDNGTALCEGRWFKLVLSSLTGGSELVFDLQSLLWRVGDTDQTG